MRGAPTTCRIHSRPACDELHGGTTFYRHRATGCESLDADQLNEMSAPLPGELARLGGLPAAYPGADHPLFEQTGYVQARFNRLIAYRSNVLHSGKVGAAPLTTDPAHARLTANTFVRFEVAEAAQPLPVSLYPVPLPFARSA